MCELVWVLCVALVRILVSWKQRLPYAFTNWIHFWRGFFFPYYFLFLVFSLHNAKWNNESLFKNNGNVQTLLRFPIITFRFCNIFPKSMLWAYCIRSVYRLELNWFDFNISMRNVFKKPTISKERSHSFYFYSENLMLHKIQYVFINNFY